MNSTCGIFFAEAIMSKERKYSVDFNDLRDYLPKVVIETLDKIGDVIAPINLVEAITPLNVASEKQKWLAEAPTSFENPKFQYNTELLKALVSLEPDIQLANSFHEQVMGGLDGDIATISIMQIAKNRLQEAQSAIDAARAILEGDSRKTGEEMMKIYGFPDASTIVSAHQYARELMSDGGMLQKQPVITASELTRLSAVKYNADSIKQGFLWVAERCGFEGTRPIEVDEYATAIDVRDKSSRGAIVVIPKTRVVTGVKLLTLAAHEILCHWRDSENAELLAKNMKGADEILYEGHAMSVESQVELMLSGKTRRLALPWRIIGMDIAKNGGNFAQVAAELYPMILAVEKDAAKALNGVWTSCMRIFRGATDTANNQRNCYVYTKDRAYFEGKTLVNALHQQGLGNLAEFGALTPADVSILLPTINLLTANLSYQYPETLIMEMYEKIMGGGFMS